MEIRQMDREACAGKKFTARYKTSGYYDIRACDMGYQLQYVPFEAAVERSFHLQILQEERYLADTFGAPYQEYCRHVFRYLGRKQRNRGE